MLLKQEIESIRESMIQVALREGLSAKETMELSQKLDELMNELHRDRLNSKCVD